MTELEIMQRAKMYLDKMANGIDPLTDSPVPDNDCINQIRISRCLFYVSDVLRKVIENGGVIGNIPDSQKAPFQISPDELKRYQISETPIPVSEVANRINALIDANAVQKLKYSAITAFLIHQGFMAEQEYAEGKKNKVPTEQGKTIGIFREERQGQSGPYYVMVYSAKAQQFILDHLDAIVEYHSSQKEAAALQGQPWSVEDDKALVDLYNRGTPMPEIAITLRRTAAAIRARLKKLGVVA